jgi:paraquat-inducible protein B
VTTGPGYATVKATDISKLNAPAITTKIAELKAQRNERQQRIKEVIELQNNPNSGMSPLNLADARATHEKVLQGLETDIRNLEVELEKRKKQ